MLPSENLLETIDTANQMIEPVMQHRQSIPCLVAQALIRLYQIAISPLLSSLFGSCCRFEPTCSQYGLEAFRRYGFIEAFKLTAKRLAKCHPGGPHGYDPVP